MNLQRRMENSIRKKTQYFSDSCLPSSCRGATTWCLYIYEAELAPPAKEWGSLLLLRPSMEGKDKDSWLGTALTHSALSLLIPSYLLTALLALTHLREHNSCLWAPSPRMLPGKWVTIHPHLHQHGDSNISTEGPGANLRHSHSCFLLCHKTPGAFEKGEKQIPQDFIPQTVEILPLHRHESTGELHSHPSGKEVYWHWCQGFSPAGDESGRDYKVYKEFQLKMLKTKGWIFSS